LFLGLGDSTAVHLDHLPGSFFGPPNLVELLQHRASHQPHDLAFTFLVDGEQDEKRVTYTDLQRAAQAIAAKLQALGLAGERALLLYPPGIDFVAAFFGCLYAGVTAVPAYPPRRNRNMNRIEAIVDDAQAKIAMTDAATLERIEGILGETPDLSKLVWLATDQLDSKLAKSWTRPDVHGETLAFLQYTSGSTGTPKGVMLTHANLMHNSALISYAFEHTRSGIGVFWLPSYHDMGLIGGILQPVFCGRPNVLMSPMAFLQKPYRWLHAITKYRATVSGGPNFAYDLCVRKITPEQRATLDLSNWSLAFNGAEPVLAETLDAFTKMFEPCGFRREAFYPCYGMAEATLMVSGGLKSAPPVVRTFDGKALESNLLVDALPDEAHAHELVGCGGNLLDQKIVIADPEQLTTLADDQVGEIWVQGPSVAIGYWNRPEESNRTFNAYLQDTNEGPFLRTGDLGFLREGELFVTGRLKDLIIIRGRNYYPQDMELTVGKCHPRIRQGQGAAFIAKVDGRDRLVILFEVERRSQREPDNTAEVFDAIRRDVAAEHELTVEAIVLVKAGAIPKTSSGKIQRHACRNAFEAGEIDEVVAQWSIWKDGSAPPARVRADVSAATVGPATLTSDSLSARSRTPIFEAAQSTAEVVLEHVRRVAKERALGMTMDSNIVELGLDSLERMEIIASLEETFGGRIPEDVLLQIETCREVAAAVEKYLGTASRMRVETAATQEVLPESYHIDQFPEIQRLETVVREIEAAGLVSPYFKVHEGILKDTTHINGKEYISFSSFNYAGMSGDKRVMEAAKRAVDEYGTSVGASRLVSGDKVIHHELESELADFIGVDATMVMPSGHGTNESTIGHLFGPGDLILYDALAHNSIQQGALLSGARRRSFPHNDWEACEKLLAELRPAYRRVLIAIEGVYSMDGDYPDLPKFIEIKKRYKALLYIDMAHCLGVMGKTGRGITEHWNVPAREVDIIMGTISKGLGSCGGFIGGSHRLIHYLKFTTPGFVFATGISPAATAAALESVRVLRDEPQRLTKLHKNAELFLTLAKSHGMNTGTSGNTPVIPIILGNSMHAMLASQLMFEQGINVQPILHPAVEEKAARLRFFITSDHTEAQIRQTVATLAKVLEQIEPRYVMHVSGNGNGAVSKSINAVTV
jgi:8-amino-7-oxononanoate synthase